MNLSRSFHLSARIIGSEKSSSSPGWCNYLMKNPENEFHSDIDKQFGATIDMNPGNFRSLFEPKVAQPEARVAGAANVRGLLAAFEQVVSRFELTNALEADPLKYAVVSERSGYRYSDLEKAFAAACPLNLEKVPALEY